MQQKNSFFTLAFLFFFMLTALQAQDYKISFTGSGLSTTFTSIHVANLTKGTTVTLGNNDILHLLGSVSGVDNVNGKDHVLTMYPNPLIETTVIKFFNSDKGLVMIEVIDITGKNVLQKSELVDYGSQTFEVSGLTKGMYMINVTTSGEKYTGKLLSGTENNDNPNIKYLGNQNSIPRKSASESAETLVPMQYSEGDKLVITATSGDYSHVLALVPSQNQTVNFVFIACTDGDNNHYPVVTIGTQIWMGKNLKTTKYNDGVSIPYPGSTNEIWVYNTTGAYAWYGNNINNKEIYGGLYNWYTVETGKLCPQGWRVPSDADWYQLENFVDGTINNPSATSWRGTNCGTKLKSKTLWTSMVGTDDFGFNALPGGLRQNTGAYDFIGAQGYWHSSTMYNTRAYAWSRSLRNVYYDINRNYMITTSGHSVRCIKNN